VIGKDVMPIVPTGPTERPKIPKADEIIQFKDTPADNWTKATVLGRAGKATGKNKHWINIREIDTGNERSIDLDGMEAWKSLESEEEVNIVMIPRTKHGETQCVKAKRVELDKLKQFGTYEEVDDQGQIRVSTTWVLWKKGEETRARLVARGF
jgi:hypothetical protein